MKKFLSLILVLVLCLFGVVGCNKKEEPKPEPDPEPTPTTYLNYTIKVVDIDGEELANKNYSTETYQTVKEALVGDLNCVGYDSQYGYSVTSIAGSIVDANWYLALYENNGYAETGVDGLVIDEGDVFEFKAECWNTTASGYGTMDETDVLVDKIIYSYMKSYVKEMLEKSNDYSSGDYWTMMALSLMESNGYDANLFDASKLTTQAYKDSLNVTDFSSVNGANWGKYYYGAKALKKDLSAFKEAYKTYMEGLADTTTYSEYATPFYLSPAKALNVENANVTKLANTDYVAGTEWGLDGWNWQMTNLSLWKTYTLEQLTNTKAEDQGNGTSTALMLLPLAANNINARTIKNAEEKDLVQILIETYYDETLNLVKWSKADTGVNYSTNQIYASLMAYKAQRDLGKAVNLFA